jgi:hypothetical protein
MTDQVPHSGSDRARSRRVERLLILVGLLLVLAAFKLAFNPGLGRNSLDGDYYFQIARNVAEGRGLETNVSLYHQGLKTFPHKSNVSPVWPLTLGTTSRIVGPIRSALLLPELFYLIALLLLYLLTNRLAAAMAGHQPGILVDGGAIGVGHVAVLIFGLNPIFFEFTSLPYTEGLAFLLVFSAVLAIGSAVRENSLAAAIVAGLLAGAGFLTRSQLIGVVLAGALVTLVLGLRSYRSIRLAAGFLFGVVTMILPWAIFLSTWIEPLTWSAFFGVLRETPEVDPFNSRVAVGSVWEFLLNRAKGLLVAFRIGDQNSYFASFGWSIFLVPLALIQLLRDRPQLRGRLEWLATPNGALTTATLLTGALMLAPVHNSHFWFFKEWLFGFRHGLPFILLVSTALAFLAANSTRAFRYLSLLLIGTSLFLGAARVGTILGRDYLSGLLGPEPQLVQWLDSQTPRPSVVTTNAQPLAVFSRSGFHWMDCREDSEKTLQLLRYANADYVLRYPGEERCPFLSGTETQLRLVREFSHQGWSVAVLAPREP